MNIARIIGVSVSALLRGAGMHWENQSRLSNGEALAYTEQDFGALAEDVERELNGSQDAPTQQEMLDAIARVHAENPSDKYATDLLAKKQRVIESITGKPADMARVEQEILALQPGQAWEWPSGEGRRAMVAVTWDGQWLRLFERDDSGKLVNNQVVYARESVGKLIDSVRAWR